MQILGSGSLKRWPNGQELANPPPGFWHYAEWSGGALYPAVLGFNQIPNLRLWVRVTGDPGAETVRLRALIGAAVIADQAYSLSFGALPAEAELVSVGRRALARRSSDCKADSPAHRISGFF